MKLHRGTGECKTFPGEREEIASLGREGREDPGLYILFSREMQI